jgi:hypothetical protein
MGGILEEARRLGKLYGLLTTAFVLFVVVVAMLSQFGLPEPVTTFLVLLITVVTYVVMGLATRTLSLPGFFLADRFVPAGLNGMAAAAAILVFPVVGLAGAFLADRLLGLAIVAGLVGLCCLPSLSPLTRKSGSVTLPDYLRSATATRWYGWRRWPRLRVLSCSSSRRCESPPTLGRDAPPRRGGDARRACCPRHDASAAPPTTLRWRRPGDRRAIAILVLPLVSLQEYGVPLPRPSATP